MSANIYFGSNKPSPVLMQRDLVNGNLKFSKKLIMDNGTYYVYFEVRLASKVCIHFP